MAGMDAAAVIGLVVQVAVIAASITLSLLNRPKGQEIEGARLEDRTTTTSTYGNPIPRIDGGLRLGGNLIWSTDIREVKTTKKSGGKGGSPSSETTEYTYFGDFAIAYCEGDGNGAVSQMFADKKLIYDMTSQATAVVKYPGAAFRFYMGGETQEPDPIMEADKGAGNVPAYRGLVFVVVEGLPLGDFGNRIPQLEAVVHTNAEVLDDVKADITRSTNGSTGSWTLPTLQWRDAKYLKTIRQMYAVDRLSAGPNAVFRVDMEANDAEEAINVIGSPFPTGYDPGLFSSEATGGDLYPERASGAHGVYVYSVYPHTDGKLFTLGVSENASAVGVYSLTRLNPLTLRGISRGPDYSNLTDTAIQLSVMSMSFTRSHIQGISNYTCLTHDTSPTQPAKIFFFDRDKEQMLDNHLIFGGNDQIDPQAVITDRNGDLYWFFWDNDADPGPNGEKTFMHRIKINRYLTVPDNEDPPAADFEIETFDLRNIGTGGGMYLIVAAAYDLSSHSIIMVGSADDSDDARWVRWDIDTQTVVVERIIDTTTEDERNVTANTKNNWTQNGVVEGFLWAATGGAVQQADPAERVLKIKTIDLTVEEVTVPNHFSDHTFGETMTLLDATAKAVFFMPVSQSLQGRPQRIQYGRVTPTPVPLTTVLQRIFLDSEKLALGDLDLTDPDLTGPLVRGFLRSDRGTTRADLQALTVPYQFDVVETADDSDAKLKVVVRGKTSIRSISEDDLAATTDALQTKDERLVIDRSQENEVPLEFDLRYIDINRDYLEGNQSAKRIQVPTPTNTSARSVSLQLPIVFTADEARQASQSGLYSSWVARTSYGLKLGPKHMDLDPTDLITVTQSEIDFLMRLGKLEVGDGFSAIIGAASDDPESYISLAEGESVDVVQTFGAPGPTELFVLDIPLLRDVDDGNQIGGGVYVAFGAFTAFWLSAVADISRTAGALWERWSLSRGGSPWGWLHSDLDPLPNDPDPEATDSGTAARWVAEIQTIDLMSSITIDMVQGIGDLESITIDELFTTVGNSNVLVVDNGESAEVIKFMTVTDNGNGTVTLSTLLRGRRGTEEAARVGHLAGVRVVFTTEDAINREGVDLTRLTITDMYRATSMGEIVEHSAIQALTWGSEDNRPYPVSKPDTDSPRDGAARGDLQLTWVRRTRVGGNADLTDGVGQDTIPLAEGTEAYEVDLIDSGLETVSTTKTVSGVGSDSTGVTITAAERVTAGYADADAFRVKIYQVSDIVGRGRPRDVTI